MCLTPYVFNKHTISPLIAPDLKDKMNTDHILSLLEDLSPDQNGQDPQASAQSQQDQPFFLALGRSKPHLPFTVPANYFNTIDLELVPLPAAPYKSENLLWLARLETAYTDMSSMFSGIDAIKGPFSMVHTYPKIALRGNI